MGRRYHAGSGRQPSCCLSGRTARRARRQPSQPRRPLQRLLPAGPGQLGQDTVVGLAVIVPATLRPRPSAVLGYTLPLMRPAAAAPSPTGARDSAPPSGPSSQPVTS